MQQLLQTFYQVNSIQSNFPRVLYSQRIEIIQLTELFEKYPNNVQKIFIKLFLVGEQKIELQKLLFEELKQKQTIMPTCGFVFKYRQKIIRCYDCQKHHGSVYCRDCFDFNLHIGHKFEELYSNGGTCDCGNAQALTTFCPNHDGKQNLYPFSFQQFYHFKQICGNIFVWVAILWNHNQYSYKQYSIRLLSILLFFLFKLNQKSLYYNTLTYLMFKDTASLHANAQKLFNNNLIDFLFQIGNHKVDIASIATQLFLSIFSLREFKIELLIAFNKAYNTKNNFQSSCFQDLFIQIYANSNIVNEILNQKAQLKQNIIINPKRKINTNIHLYNLLFLVSIEHKTSLALLKQIFMLQKPPKSKRIQEIIDNVEKGTETIVNYISSQLAQQNLYYHFISSILKKYNDSSDLMQMMMRSYAKAVLQNPFVKNKQVLVYHRVLSSIIFASFEYNLQKISLERLLYNLGLNVVCLQELLLKIYDNTLHCLADWVITLQEPSYFNRYLDLYITQGSKVVNYDYLTLKISVLGLNLLGKIDLVINILQQMMDVDKNFLLKTQPQRFVYKWCNLLRIFVEINFSFRDQFFIQTKCTQVNIENLNYNQCKYQLMRDFFYQIKKIKIQEFKKISIILFDSNEEQNIKTLRNIVIFDRQNKQMIINEEIKHANPFCLKYMLSVKQANVMKDIIYKVEKPSFIPVRNQIYMNTLLQKKNVHKIINLLNEAIMQVKIKDEKKQKQLSLINSLEILFKDTIQQISLMHENKLQISQSIEKQLSLKQIKQKNFQQTINKKKIQELKRNKKKKLIQEKRNEILKKYEIIVDQKNDKQNVCSICRQTGKQNLYHMFHMSFSNNMQTMLKQKGYNSYFTMCQHLFHYDCRKKEQIKGFNRCPFCNFQGHFYFPQKIHKQHFDMKRIEANIFQRNNSFIQNQPGIAKIGNIFLFFVQFVFFHLFDEKKIKDILCAKVVFSFLNAQIQNKTIKQRQKLVQNFKSYPLQISTAETLQKYIIFQQMIIEALILGFQFVPNHIVCLKQFNIKYYLAYINTTDIINSLTVLQEITQMNYQKHLALLQNYQKNQINPIIEFLQTFFQPKNINTIYQLLKIRDKILFCKINHNHFLVWCVLCQEAICIQCKTNNIEETHIRSKHFGNAVMVIPIDGHFFIVQKNISQQKNNLYQNEIGVTWKASMEPQGFKLNIQKYRKLMKNTFFHIEHSN